MNPNEIKDLFVKSRALLEGHFQLTSGRHSDQYMQCALVLQYPDVAETLAVELVKKMKAENNGKLENISAVCSPAIGGIVFGQAVAKALNVKAIFAERENGLGALMLRRGFSIKEGENILAVEDVITTGGSLKEVVSLINQAGANAVGAAALVERSSVDVEFGTKKSVLLKLTLKDYMPSGCPLCISNIPLVKPGSRAK